MNNCIRLINLTLFCIPLIWWSAPEKSIWSDALDQVLVITIYNFIRMYVCQEVAISVYISFICVQTFSLTLVIIWLINMYETLPYEISFISYTCSSSILEYLHVLVNCILRNRLKLFGQNTKNLFVCMIRLSKEKILFPDKYASMIRLWFFL